MSIADIFTSRNKPMCIICRERCPAERSDVLADKLCICGECGGKIRRFSSSAVFGKKRDLKFHIAAFPYEGALREAFVRYKFCGERAYGEIFSKLMCECLEKLWSPGDFEAVVPVPLSKERMNERGYNQSAILAKNIAACFGAEYSEALLRIRHTERQSGLDAKKRAGNVRGAFSADGEKIGGRKILLIDDIYTMGATMSECAVTLKSSGAAEVAGFSLFAAVPPEEWNKAEYEFPEKQ